MRQTFPISLHCHSRTQRLHFKGSDQTRPYNVFEFLNSIAQRDFTGATIDTRGPNCGHIGGNTSEHFARLKHSIQHHQLRLELETSGTRLNRLSQMLDVCHATGADTLITRLEYSTGGESEQFRWAMRDLKAIMPYMDSLNIQVMIENTEQYPSRFFRDLIQEANHPKLGLQFNPKPTLLRGEDLFNALDTLLPFVRRSLVSSYAWVQPELGRLFLQSTALGEGQLNLTRLTQRQFNAGVRRFCFAPEFGRVSEFKSAIARPLLSQHSGKVQALIDSENSPNHLAMFNESMGFDLSLQWYKQQLSNQHYVVIPEKKRQRSSLGVY